MGKYVEKWNIASAFKAGESFEYLPFMLLQVAWTT
jgi:hypothetical protein